MTSPKISLSIEGSSDDTISKFDVVIDLSRERESQTEYRDGVVSVGTLVWILSGMQEQQEMRGAVIDPVKFKDKMQTVCCTDYHWSQIVVNDDTEFVRSVICERRDMVIASARIQAIEWNFQLGSSFPMPDGNKEKLLTQLLKRIDARLSYYNIKNVTSFAITSQKGCETVWTLDDHAKAERCSGRLTEGLGWASH